MRFILTFHMGNIYMPQDEQDGKMWSGVFDSAVDNTLILLLLLGADTPETQATKPTRYLLLSVNDHI